MRIYRTVIVDRVAPKDKNVLWAEPTEGGFILHLYNLGKWSSITTTDIINDSVIGTDQIQNGAITSEKISNESILDSHLSKSLLDKLSKDNSIPVVSLDELDTYGMDNLSIVSGDTINIVRLKSNEGNIIGICIIYYCKINIPGDSISGHLIQIALGGIGSSSDSQITLYSGFNILWRYMTLPKMDSYSKWNYGFPYGDPFIDGRNIKPLSVGSGNIADNSITKNKLASDIQLTPQILDIGKFNSKDAACSYAARSEIAGNKDAALIVFKATGATGAELQGRIFQMVNGESVSMQYLMWDKRLYRRNVTGAIGTVGNPTNAYAWEETGVQKLEVNNGKLQIKSYENNVISQVDLNDIIGVDGNLSTVKLEEHVLNVNGLNTIPEILDSYREDGIYFFKINYDYGVTDRFCIGSLTVSSWEEDGISWTNQRLHFSYYGEYYVFQRHHGGTWSDWANCSYSTQGYNNKLIYNKINLTDGANAYSTLVNHGNGIKEGEVRILMISDSSGNIPSLKGESYITLGPSVKNLFSLSESSIGASVGDLVVISKLNNIPIYRILPLNDVKAANGNFPGSMGLSSPWDKTQINKVPNLETSVNNLTTNVSSALKMPTLSAVNNNMNNALESGFYPYCNLGRPSGSTGWFTLVVKKSSNTDDNGYYTVEQTAYGRSDESGRIFKRLIFIKDSDTQFMDWVEVTKESKSASAKIGFSDLSNDLQNSIPVLLNMVLNEEDFNNPQVMNELYRESIQSGTLSGASPIIMYLTEINGREQKNIIVNHLSSNVIYQYKFDTEGCQVRKIPFLENDSNEVDWESSTDWKDAMSTDLDYNSDTKVLSLKFFDKVVSSVTLE